MIEKDITSAQPADRHDGYLAIYEMNLPMKQRCRILNEVISWHPDAWKVVGITPAALEIFAQHNFKRVAKMGIQRAHLVDRADTYREMLNTCMSNCDEWWEYYCNNDRTVFSTVEENMGDMNIDTIIWFDAPGLFNIQGFAWRHRKIEIEFLRNLYDTTHKNCNNQTTYN